VARTTNAVICSSSWGVNASTAKTNYPMPVQPALLQGHRKGVVGAEETAYFISASRSPR